MNNEELSDKIANKHCYNLYKFKNSKGLESSYDECKFSAMEMATIKDGVIKNQEQMIFACKSDIKRLQIANRNLCSELRNQAKKIRKFKAEKDNICRNYEEKIKSQKREIDELEKDFNDAVGNFMARSSQIYSLEKEIENQEKSLLWTLYSILDGLAIEGEARKNAINEFKEHLKYYKDE